MNRPCLVLVFLALVAAPLAYGQTAEEGWPRPYLHHPALSANGELLAFCYQGDIWIAGTKGGTVRRLTDHLAYDTRPAFSPTQARLAFSSDREGGMDVYLMPVEGGPPRRLTFHSADDIVVSFTPDGRDVLFLSRRDTLRHRLYLVSLSGGEPRMLLDAPVAGGSLSHDGRNLVFVSGAMSRYRRNYRGSANFDLWVKPLGGPRANRITTFAGNDLDPQWGPDGSIYFVSDRKGVANLWKVNPKEGSEPVQLTNHARHPVTNPSISAGGRFLTYACLEGGLYLMDLKEKKTRQVTCAVVTDPKENGILRKVFSDGAGEMALSPDGTEVAFSVRGEVFVVGRKEKRARRLTEGPANDREVTWTPDGKALVFVSDRSGVDDLFIVRSDEKGEDKLSKARYFKVASLVKTTVRKSAPCVSPDGKLLLYLSGLGDLYVVPMEGGKPKLLAAGPMVDDASWSPDSRWVTFSRSGKDWNSEVFVVKGDGDTAVNITQDPDEDWEPAFGPRGEYLYFTSSRGGGERFNVYRVPLTLAVAQRYKEDEEKEDEEEEDEDEDEEDGEKGKKKGRGKNRRKRKKKDEKPVVVSIDFKEIEDRARQVTSTRGNDTRPVLSDDGKTLFFKSNSLGFYEIWRSKSDGSALTRLTRSKDNPQEMAWNKKKKELVYRTGSVFRTLSSDGSRKGAIGYRARMAIDLKAERLQAFDQAWALLRDYFYDAQMHGVDWAECKSVYRRFAEGCTSTDDFNTIVSQMLGELGASHLGIWGPGNGRSPEPTGFTGLRFNGGPKGLRFNVVRVLKDSPADREASKVSPGAFLVSVNRKPVKAGQNLALLFNSTVGEKVDLALAETEEGPVTKTVTLKPVNPRTVRSLLYESWVDDNRRKVESVPAARLGYIHIRAMSGGSFRRFRREYLAKVRDRDGLVLDVRNNPGGYIHNQLWELLSKRKPVGFFRIRGADSELQPDFTWQKPVVLLINERSASDAEIFPHGFRKLGIGKVIGVPTWGGVIGTGGTRLINGAWFRLPYVGWYTDEGVNLENLGVPPDIRVENHPEEASAGRDSQLERAVEELVKGILKKK